LRRFVRKFRPCARFRNGTVSTTTVLGRCEVIKQILLPCASGEGRQTFEFFEAREPSVDAGLSHELLFYRTIRIFENGSGTKGRCFHFKYMAGERRGSKVD
jgi:hypothetical protein